MVNNQNNRLPQSFFTTVVLNHYYLGHGIGTTANRRLGLTSCRSACCSRASAASRWARYRKSLKPLELNAQHFVVLKQLEAIGTSSQASLADALGLDYSNLATITGELADRGLIERYRHESDKRRYVVELSETRHRDAGRGRPRR